MAHEPAVLRQLLEKVRRDGYALREAWFMRETGSIAVPVMVDGVPRCTVAITYISSAISAAAVVDRFAPLLQQAASEIAAALTAREGALA